MWADLVALGAAVREEPLYSDAWAVACETMRRVRKNIELLIPRLDALDYRFAHPPVFTPPAPDVHEIIVEFERRIGAASFIARIL